jgi:predicted ATPase
VAVNCHLSWALHLLGHPDRALEVATAGLTEARRLSHASSEAFALSFACILHQLRREPQPAQALAERLVSLTIERAFSYLLAWGRLIQGWASIEQGQVDAGIAQGLAGIDTYKASGARTLIPYFWTLLIEGYIKSSQQDKALQLLKEAWLQVKQTGERWIEAELYRLQGEVLLHAPQEVEHALLKAIQIARNQGARLWELRAASSLARLWRDQSKSQQAYDLLAPIHHWFTEGLDTADLKDAKAALEDVTPRVG